VVVAGELAVVALLRLKIVVVGKPAAAEQEAVAVQDFSAVAVQELAAVVVQDFDAAE